MRAIVVALMLLLVGLGPSMVQAREKCGFMDQVTGKCKPSKKEKGLDNVNKELGDIAYSSVNFWYKIIYDYQTGTAEERRTAEVMAERMFGSAKVLEKANPLQVRLYLRGVDTTEGDLDIAILKDYATTIEDLSSTLKEGRRSDFNFQRVTGVAKPSPDSSQQFIKDRDQLKRTINANSRKFVQEFTDLHRRILDRQSRFEACNASASSRGVNSGRLSQEKYQACMKDNVAELSRLLSGMVRPLVDNRELLATDPISVAVPWNGEPFITLVIPEEQLKLHQQLEVEMVIHLSDDESMVVPEFAANPLEISPQVMRQSAVIESRRTDIGQGRLQAETVTLAF